MPHSSTDATRPSDVAAADDVLSRSALRAMRQFLNAYREGWLLDVRLAVAARIAAEDAHRHGAAPERMLVALKRAWGSLDEVQRLPLLEARALRERLVTLGIRAYFRPSHRPGPAGPAGAAGARAA